MGSTSSARVAFAALTLLSLAASSAEAPWRSALASTSMTAEQRKLLQTAYETKKGLLWFQSDRPTVQARALGEALSHSDEKGLDPSDYGMPALGAKFADPASKNPDEQAGLDIALSRAALQLLRDLGRGRIDPREVNWQLGAEAPKPPLAEQLAGLSSASDVPSFIEGVETPFAIYKRTSLALHNYLGLAARGEGVALPPWKKTIEPGQSAEGLDALAARLTLIGDLAPGASAFASYDGALVAAVKHYQERHGFKADGRIDKHTYEAIAVPFAVRAQQLGLALERMRWLPRDLAPPLIIVNIPEFKVHALAPGGAPALTMRVVVGKAFHHKTPVFMTEVTAIQFHPYWNVPKNIAEHELMPKYIARHHIGAGFELVDGRGHALAGAITSEVERDVASGAYRLRQLPGSENALGPLKLEMPDRFEVYLHGTPTPEKFEHTRRDFSHGCIRVEDPAALATWALSSTPGWSEDRVRAAVAEPVAVRAALEKPIKVLILYSTSVVTDDGLVSFFDDVYGNDALLTKALAKRRELLRVKGMLASRSSK